MALPNEPSLRLDSLVPVIETERLRLRAHRVQDFSACCAMWADPVVTRYLGGQPFSPEEVWARLLRYAGHWLWVGFGYWAIELKTSGEFVGELGLANFHRNLEPSLGSTPELGWALVSSQHGRGLATEAVQAVAAWADQHLGAAETACLMHSENKASLRVATKCGYGEPAPGVYKGQPVLVYRRQARAVNM